MKPQPQNTGNTVPPLVHFAPAAIPQGDGSFLIKPGKPLLGREKVTISEAVKRFGLSRTTWMRLVESGMIEGVRPSPRKTYLYMDSILEHLKRAQDGEYWNDQRTQQFRRAL